MKKINIEKIVQATSPEGDMPLSDEQAKLVGLRLITLIGDAFAEGRSIVTAFDKVSTPDMPDGCRLGYVAMAIAAVLRKRNLLGYNRPPKTEAGNV